MAHIFMLTTRPANLHHSAGHYQVAAWLRASDRPQGQGLAFTLARVGLLCTMDRTWPGGWASRSNPGWSIGWALILDEVRMTARTGGSHLQGWGRFIGLRLGAAFLATVAAGLLVSPAAWWNGAGQGAFIRLVSSPSATPSATARVSASPTPVPSASAVASPSPAAGAAVRPVVKTTPTPLRPPGTVAVASAVSSVTWLWAGVLIIVVFAALFWAIGIPGGERRLAWLHFSDGSGPGPDPEAAPASVVRGRKGRVAKVPGKEADEGSARGEEAAVPELQDDPD